MKFIYFSYLANIVVGELSESQKENVTSGRHVQIGGDVCCANIYMRIDLYATKKIPAELYGASQT